MALRSVARSGGRVVTADFVDSEAAVQLEDEELEAEMRRAAYGSEVYGIGTAGTPDLSAPGASPGRAVAIHATTGDPSPLETGPGRRGAHDALLVPAEVAWRLRERRRTLRDRILNEGYTRPATLYVEGLKGF